MCFSSKALPTIVDVWVNGRHVLHSQNMFRAYEVDTGPLEAGNELLVRFSSMTSALAVKRPRPRWKTYLISHQNLRFFRTSLLGGCRGGPRARPRFVRTSRSGSCAPTLCAWCSAVSRRTVSATLVL